MRLQKTLEHISRGSINKKSRLDKTILSISSPFNANLIENFKLICSAILERIARIVNSIDVYKVSGISDV